jgi:hypothetical protein
VRETNGGHISIKKWFMAIGSFKLSDLASVLPARVMID